MGLLMIAYDLFRFVLIQSHNVMYLESSIACFPINIFTNMIDIHGDLSLLKHRIPWAAINFCIQKEYLFYPSTLSLSSKVRLHPRFSLFRDDDKFGRRDRFNGPTSEFKEKDGFKPNVKLEYIDDDGHVLSAKEAFRYLSHKFHGKGPGKNKVRDFTTIVSPI